VLATKQFASACENTYDANGNMTWDANSRISAIQYNLLNLPDVIQFADGHQNYYTYDASGKKLNLINYTLNSVVNVPQGTISQRPPAGAAVITSTDYIGNMIYQSGSLKMILTPEGYIQNGVYYYYLKDHLGNTRVVINSNGTIIEKSHYYPTGMRFYPESTSNSGALPYRLTGKELETMNGLNQYDFGARRRMTGIPIWTTMDPKCEKRPWESPYAVCGNNFVNRIDPTGMDFSESLNLSWDYERMKESGLVPNDEKFTIDFRDPTIALTYITPSGVVIRHDPDAVDKNGNYDDRVIRVNKDGTETQVGTEYDDVTYETGKLAEYRGLWGPMVGNMHVQERHPALNNVYPEVAVAGALRAGGATISLLKWAYNTIFGSPVSMTNTFNANSGLVQFGKDANQNYHAFRHVEELGLNKTAVENAVKTDLQNISSTMVSGKPYDQIISVSGIKLQYTAYKLPDGTINIGRIHGVK